MSTSSFVAINRRALLRTVMGLSAEQLTGCATIEKPACDAVVVKGANTLHSEPVFPSIQSALDAAPANATRPFRILITQGRWREKLTIDKPFIHLVGEDRALSRVSYDAYAGKIAPDGQPWGTLRSATITVRAPDFLMSNLTVENDFDYPRLLLSAQSEPTGPNRLQAVALILQSGSDRVRVDRCNISGYQDTLCPNAGRSLFRECRISGTVDFIFGAGSAVFEDCVLLSRFRPVTERQGYVVAPSTPRTQPYGFVFTDCRLAKENKVPANSVSLGRAWRPTTTFADGRYGDPNAVGMAAYINCWMDVHIAIEGWDAMEYGARDGSRLLLLPEAARFSEYRSRGPGASTDARRRRLSEQEVKRYGTETLLADW